MFCFRNCAASDLGFRFHPNEGMWQARSDLVVSFQQALGGVFTISFLFQSSN